MANIARAESPVHLTATAPFITRIQQGRMDESRRWRSCFLCVGAWAGGPGWYEPGLWPILFGMPQSLSLVVIHVILSTKDRGPFLYVWD